MRKRQLKKVDKKNARSDKIEKRGNKFVVLSESGDKVLGSYNTETEASIRLKQIEFFKNKKDSIKKDSVYRTDRLGIISLDASRKDEDGVLKAELTPEGFIRCKGRIARTGPQIYNDEMGNEWIEYRPEEEVFNPKSMKSFEMIIVTDDHPPEMINVDNVDQYKCGVTGSSVTKEDKYLVVDILITNKDLISKIQNGDKNELSCGYWTTVIDKDGVCPETGTAYKKVQTDIGGNHLSVVEEGRAGPECKLYTDSAVSLNKDLKGFNKMKKISKDGKLMIGEMEFEVPDEVMAYCEELKAKVEEQGAKLSELSAQGDELPMEEKAMDEEEMPAEEKKPEESMDALKAKIDYLSSPTRIDARVNLVTNARSIVPGLKTDGASDLGLMSAVVNAVTPSMDLKGKSRDYIKAAYDMALEAHKKNTDSNNELFGVLANADSAPTGADSKLDAMRAKFYGGKK